MDYADIVRPDEMAAARQWVEQTLAHGTAVALAEKTLVAAGPCFEFTYDGQPSGEHLAAWDMTRQQTDGVGRQQHRSTWTDPATGLQCVLELTRYTDFPVAEWVLRFKNTGDRPTPILQDIRSLDLRAAMDKNTLLHTMNGDWCHEQGYEPHVTRLEDGTDLSFASQGGRGTDRAWPYYNIEYPQQNRGLILVIGWPGQWASRFTCRLPELHVQAGQQTTHLRLLPGEEIRTPLSVLMFYTGDRVRSQNLWRRWMLAHNLPRPAGQLPRPMLPAGSNGQFFEMVRADEASQFQFIDRYREQNIPIDYWWMDAGWYPCGDHWWHTGTWEPDTQRFPRGLRTVTDHAHKEGLRCVVWFEPERVFPGTWLDTQHPEWLLSLQEAPKDTCKLLNLGHAQARQWLIDHVDRLIGEQGIDLYRQDFNFEPLAYWRNSDSPDRLGITENHHVTGYLAWWDELRRRHPNVLLDSCASGGRRNDLETLRRAVPLHKTDYNYADLPAKQAFHHSLFSWVPYFGAPVLPVDAIDPYAFRSAMAPCTALGFDVRRDDLDYKLLAELGRQWHQVADLYFGDYYPLLPFSRDDRDWMAWQFDRPDLGTGLLQAFRRADSPFTAAAFQLRGLQTEATYSVTDLDTPWQSDLLRGQDLMTDGIRVEINERPHAVVLLYERL